MPLDDVKTEFAGRRGRLFKLALWTSLLTVLTVGIYRFWMKTRLRRFYWSSIRPGGHPLEYVGEPVEKLLGFLIAVVVLAFYIGVVNLLLMFASFTLFNGNTGAYVASFVGVIPILFFARYRARRYILARTRWRGVRFGLEPAAWGYAWRALVHWSITILSLGLLYPRQMFYLEKYRTDHTTFGSTQLHQGGRWQMLYPPMKSLIVAVSAAAILIAMVYYGKVTDSYLMWLFALAPLALVSFIRLKVYAFRTLTSHKTAGPISFWSSAKTGRIVRVYLLGSLLLAIVMTLAITPLGLVGYMLQSCGVEFANAALCEQYQATPRWVLLVVTMVFYFLVFITWGVMKQVLITLPVRRHYAETLKITGAGYLTHVTQSERDEFTEAEGFAEALDLGAAI